MHKDMVRQLKDVNRSNTTKLNWEKQEIHSKLEVTQNDAKDVEDRDVNACQDVKHYYIESVDLSTVW